MTAREFANKVFELTGWSLQSPVPLLISPINTQKLEILTLAHGSITMDRISKNLYTDDHLNEAVAVIKATRGDKEKESEDQLNKYEALAFELNGLVDEIVDAFVKTETNPPNDIYRRIHVKRLEDILKARAVIFKKILGMDYIPELPTEKRVCPKCNMDEHKVVHCPKTDEIMHMWGCGTIELPNGTLLEGALCNQLTNMFLKGVDPKAKKSKTQAAAANADDPFAGLENRDCPNCGAKMEGFSYSTAYDKLITQYKWVCGATGESDGSGGITMSRNTCSAKNQVVSAIFPPDRDKNKIEHLNPFSGETRTHW